MAKFKMFLEDFEKLKFSQRKNILESELVVYEKFNAPRIEFYRSDNKVKFFRKGKEFNLGERIICNIFEDLINEINSIPLELLPNLTKFEISYFPKNKPALLEYQNIPESSFLIVSAKNLSENYYYKIKDLPRLLEESGLEYIKPIWNGVLNTHQKTMMTGFLKSGSEDLRIFMNRIFPETSFTLNEDLSMPIDSIILSFGDMEFRFKDPLGTKILEQETKKRKSLDFYGLIMSSFIDFTKSIKIKDYIWEKNSDIEKQFVKTIELISAEYIREHSSDFEDVEFGGVSDIISKELLEKSTLEILDIPNSENVFRMIYQSLWIPRKKITGTFTESLLNDIQNFRKAISTEINIKDPSYIPTFLEYEIIKSKTNEIY